MHISVYVLLLNIRMSNSGCFSDSDTDGASEFPASGISSKELVATQAKLQKDMIPLPQSTSLPAKYGVYNSSSSIQRDLLSSDFHRSDLHRNDLHRNDLKASIVSTEDDFRFGSIPKSAGYDSLESIVRIKEAEARMFQSKADEARREAEEYRRIIRTKTVNLEEEYSEKLAKLCLQETDERRRKKLEELKVLENSHDDYYNMKKRMQVEISGLLERMEATKQQWV